MSKQKRRTLANTKGQTSSRRPKPMVAKSGITRRRTPYKNGGQVDK